MTKLSVIMPVYNVAKYLPMCLDSIICQTLDDIEIICVNDGSTDESLSVLQEYKEKDSRIIIIDKKNEGSGVARNTALAIAQGEYVYFVDGDDWLDNDSVLKMLYEKAMADELDILIFGGLSCYEKEGQIFNLMDTNGRRNDVINALQGYLTILDDSIVDLIVMLRDISLERYLSSPENLTKTS